MVAGDRTAPDAERRAAVDIDAASVIRIAALDGSRRILTAVRDRQCRAVYQPEDVAVVRFCLREVPVDAVAVQVDGDFLAVHDQIGIRLKGSVTRSQLDDGATRRRLDLSLQCAPHRKLAGDLYVGRGHNEAGLEPVLGVFRDHDLMRRAFPVRICSGPGDIGLGNFRHRRNDNRLTLPGFYGEGAERAVIRFRHVDGIEVRHLYREGDVARRHGEAGTVLRAALVICFQRQWSVDCFLGVSVDELQRSGDLILIRKIRGFHLQHHGVSGTGLPLRASLGFDKCRAVGVIIPGANLVIQVGAVPEEGVMDVRAIRERRRGDPVSDKIEYGIDVYVPVRHHEGKGGIVHLDIIDKYRVGRRRIVDRQQAAACPGDETGAVLQIRPDRDGVARLRLRRLNQVFPVLHPGTDRTSCRLIADHIRVIDGDGVGFLGRILSFLENSADAKADPVI